MKKIHVLSLWVVILIAGMLLPPVIPAAHASAYQNCMNSNAAKVVNPPPGFPKCSQEGRLFNKQIWDDLGIMVWGSPEQVPQNRLNSGFKTSWLDPNDPQRNERREQSPDGKHPYFNHYITGQKGEYRYLGWDRLDQPMTNPFFFDDARSGKNASDKVWIYRPWQSNPLLNGRPDKPNVFSPVLITPVVEGPDDIYGLGTEAVENANRIVKSRDVQVRYAVNDADPNKSVKNLFDYMYVQQDPTVWAEGSGRMFHQSSMTGKVYVQSFPIDKLEMKHHTPVQAVLQPSHELVTDLLNMEDTFTWKFDLAGVLLDDEYYGKRYEQALYYTRDDVSEWKLELSVSYPGHPLSVVATRTSMKNGDLVLKDGQKEAEAKSVSVSFNKANFDKNSRIRLSLKATAVFGDGQTATSTVTKTILLNETDVIPTGRCGSFTALGGTLSLILSAQEMIC